MSRDLLTDVLRDVSRAFYLTLRVLPAGCREPVGVAYLLARAADTIADTRALPPDARLRALLAFREAVENRASAVALPDLERPRIAVLGDRPAIDAGEATLLRRLPEVLALYQGLGARDGDAVRDIVVTLTRGMEVDLQTFPAEDSGQVAALGSADDLERYIWYVAGCVGDFWTRVTFAHTPALRGWDVARMAEIGQDFGKALQLVNVLRDIPRDLRNGRCYLPADELAEVGLVASDLLDPRATTALRPVTRRWTARARHCFASAEAYVLAIPRRCTRLRLAALWPVLIGLATLRELERADAWLDGTRRIKVSRGWIYRMLILSIPASFSDTLLRRWFAALGPSQAMEGTP